MPVIDHAKVSTFADYAYAAHDQAEFLSLAMEEIRSMHDSHFMTKKTKELMKDKKRLEAELAITKSPGTSADRGTYDTMQSKYDSTFQKLARIEEDRDLLKQKLAQMI